MADGTGSGKAQHAFYDDRSLTTTASEELDLTAIAAAFGDVVFSKIKQILIEVTTATSGYRLEVGGAAANAWTEFVKDASDIVMAYAGGCTVLYNSPVNGGTVDGTHKMLKIYNPSGGTVAYKIWIVGEGALA